ncbi:MAG: mechanosensitive ion channel family protein [Lachnospiraceae bacterium]|nr:mechanosensitive ion channel family protein [Lachnospiraceae bacterium]
MSATEEVSVSIDSVSNDIAEISDTLSNIKDINSLKEEVTKGFFANYLDTLPPKLFNLGVRVIFALICLFIGSKLIKFARKLINRSLEKAGIDKGISHFIDSCVKFLLYVILIMIVASGFGVDATSIVAILGSIGLTIGLALQGSFSNFAGGIILLLMKPFKVGDYIIEDSHKNEGVVTSIQLFYTTLRTIDNKVVLIPNGTLCNSSMTNVTWHDERCVDFSVGISYGSDLLLAKETLKNLVMEDEDLLRPGDINIFVRELADSAVVLGARYFVRTPAYFKSIWHLNEAVKLKFDEIGIEIPFNQMDVHIKEK